MKFGNLRPKPQLPTILKNVPFLHTLFEGTAQGIYPYIFVPKDIYENLNSTNPYPYHISLIIHEQTHLDRQIKYGWSKWMMKYLFDSKFRFDEEIEANKKQMNYMKKHNLKFPFEMKAKILSSWVYLKPVNYNEALSRLKRVWKNS